MTHEEAATLFEERLSSLLEGSDWKPVNDPLFDMLFLSQENKAAAEICFRQNNTPPELIIDLAMAPIMTPLSTTHIRTPTPYHLASLAPTLVATLITEAFPLHMERLHHWMREQEQ